MVFAVSPFPPHRIRSIHVLPGSSSIRNPEPASHSGRAYFRSRAGSLGLGGWVESLSASKAIRREVMRRKGEPCASESCSFSAWPC